MVVEGGPDIKMQRRQTVASADGIQAVGIVDMRRNSVEQTVSEIVALIVTYIYREVMVVEGMHQQAHSNGTVAAHMRRDDNGAHHGSRHCKGGIVDRRHTRRSETLRPRQRQHIVAYCAV